MPTDTLSIKNDNLCVSRWAGFVRGNFINSNVYLIGIWNHIKEHRTGTFVNNISVGRVSSSYILSPGRSYTQNNSNTKPTIYEQTMNECIHLHMVVKCKVSAIESALMKYHLSWNQPIGFCSTFYITTWADYHCNVRLSADFIFFFFEWRHPCMRASSYLPC